MLDSRHRKTRSSQRITITSASNSNASHYASQPAIASTGGTVEWSKTSSRVCSRLVPSLDPIFNRLESLPNRADGVTSTRGSNFNGVAADSYGLLLSNDSAFIFPYTSSSTVPPILTFPLPQGEDRLLGALVPGSTNEPGLLVVMPTAGRIGYWPAIHSALAPSTGIETKLALGNGEYMTHVCNAGAAGVVLSSSTGRLVHVSLRDAAGKPIVHLTNMSANNGWLGALRTMSTRKTIVAIKAGAAQSREERQVHVITENGQLTIWDIARGGNHRSILDMDLGPLLRERDITSVYDVVAFPLANHVLILCKTIQGLAQVIGVKFDSQGEHASTFHNSILPSITKPRIFLPNPGHVAIVHTASAVFLITIETGSIDMIRFHDHVQIVAVGDEDQLKNKRNPGLVLLTDGAGVLKVEVFPEPKARYQPKKARIEQAIFYGDKELNPINFSPAPEDIEIEARELSLEILKGRSPYMPASAQLGDHFRRRMQALSELIKYVRWNVKATTLQVMREHAEKMAAGQALWESVDSRMESTSLISKLLPIAHNDPLEPLDRDPVRFFFLQGLQQIHEVIPNAHRACVEAAAVLDPQPLKDIVKECNELILAVLGGALRHRKMNPEYGSDGDKWTSAKEILQCITIQFDITKRFGAGTNISDEDPLKDQMVGLANINCQLYKDYLEMSKPDTLDHKQISTRYANGRPLWLKSLVQCGRGVNAFNIGEAYHDYLTLIEMCHEEGRNAIDEFTVGSVVRRLEWYLHVFGYDFAAVLWEYYVSNRQFWNLLHEFPEHRATLTKFFSDGRYPHISWMNDVLIKDFANASASLLKIPEKNIEKRRIQLSIAKLAALVDASEVPDDIRLQIKCSIIMRSLLTEVKEVSKDAIDAIAAADIASAVLIPAKFTNPDRKALLRRYITKLTSGEILSLGETVDYMTTKSNPDFFNALEFLQASTVPHLAQSFFESLIWRRCIVSDDCLKIIDTKSRSDSTIQEAIKLSNLCSTMKRCRSSATNSNIRIPPPHETRYTASGVIPIEGLSSTELQNLQSEYQAETRLIDRYINAVGFSTIYNDMIEAAGQYSPYNSDDEFVQVMRPEMPMIEQTTTNQPRRHSKGSDGDEDMVMI